MSAGVCCVMSSPEWFDELQAAHEPNGPVLRYTPDLDAAVGERASLYLIHPPNRSETLTVLRELGRRARDEPLRMVVADDADEIDRVVAFELGADDFVTEPVSFREIALRMRALLRRVNASAPSHHGDDATISFGPLVLDGGALITTLHGARLPLTTAEFRLLRYLARAPGVVRRRGELLEEVWGTNATINLRTVDTHVKRIRQKLRPLDVIKTVRGVGYRFDPPL